MRDLPVMKRAERWARRAISSSLMVLRHRRLKGVRKVFYCKTPTHPNIGDHAMAVAISRWISEHFPGLPLLELDMKQVSRLLPAVKWLAGEDDLVFLHSGGNMGDLYEKQELWRRALIGALPHVRIVSLPQTISFSDTPVGRAERETSQRIYNAHPRLTVMARDPYSAELAEQLFPNARTLCVPDFSLSLDPPVREERKGRPRGMLCLRTDRESALTSKQREELRAALRYDWCTYDTVIDEHIDRTNRESVVAEALKRFSAVDIVVTDRFHGVIFATLCRRPCVALPTIDHKLTAGSSWFDDVPCFAMAGSVREVPELVEKCLRAEVRDTPSWSADNFDGLPAELGLR